MNFVCNRMAMYASQLRLRTVQRQTPASHPYMQTNLYLIDATFSLQYRINKKITSLTVKKKTPRGIKYIRPSSV